ncbi:DcaP family trimeric outer membrane transporter [Alcanivorax sp. S6407]|uniref:DcaP family trimeric outer membrane transporter n=1 Tax=Alcanivorax sp. S6407 TaxID=2926424 RepID=UPI001FF499A9|nr:DcaP family trimeric outer membrane transporter [Alcanivorax sp. S6407]MCK0154382.1 DcaP family trimeric outer membrane transporter [Alcanivorax sp. S6407]
MAKTFPLKGLGALALMAPLACVAAETDSSFSLYGYAMVDYVQAFDRPNPDWEATLRPSRIPTHASDVGSDGQAILSARQSRFGVDAATMAGDSMLTTKFEFDLYGVGADEGQTTIRLRHAYGEWKSILAGQTNSVFMDGDVFPNVIDYWGPSGMAYLRNPQIRWTPVKGDSTVAVAIETPGSGVDTTGTAQSGHNPYPDLTAHFRQVGDWGHFQVAGILRQVAYDTPGTGDAKPEDSEFGWGVNLTTTVNVMERDRLILGVLHGEGVSNYMNDGGTDMALDGGTVADPDYQVVPVTGLVAYYEHGWSDAYSTAFGYSSTEIDNMDLQGPDAFNKGEYASINLLHTPNDKVMMGVEYLFGKRTANDGDKGYDRRVQFSVKYNFSSGNLL